VSVTVEVARHASDELVASINHLLPQLSSSALPLTMRDLEELIGSPAVTLFVASNSGAIVGTLTLVVIPIPSGLRAWIEDVVVDESSRGLGVGAALTTAAIDEARQRDVRSVDLTSRPSREAANSMYRSLGFELRETNVYRFLVEP
jgi:ribosomal protein S18 acetylase RimI-like enzyme